MGEDIIIFEAFLEDGVKKARELVRENNVRIIISRGATGALIKKNVDIPVVSIEITDFDVFLAIYESSVKHDSIGFFGYDYKKGHFNFDLFSRILNKKISYFYYKTDLELKMLLEKARNQGITIAVGTGACILTEAVKLGMEGRLVLSNRSSVMQAINTAKNICSVLEKDAAQKELMKTLLDYSNEGIMALDEDKRIILFNPKAEKLLEIPGEEILSKKIQDVNSSNINRIFERGEPALQKIIEINKTKLLVNRANINVNSQKRGTVITFQEISKIQELEINIREELYKKGLTSSYSFEDILGSSRPLKEAIEMARKYSKTNSTVLIIGESGTGKELFANSIHAASPRANGPFVAVNCAALPESLLESELFGYEEGAFTGAKKGGKVGLFELAHGGSLFLDEIGEMPLGLQAQILRVIQEKKVMRLGGNKLIPVDVRIIAATNIDLKKRIQEGKFRSDLFYRLNILTLKIPPLRERPEDIIPLTKNFIEGFSNTYNKKVNSNLSKAVIEYLQSYNWPGNVRELKNLMEKCVILTEKQDLDINLIKNLITESDIFRDTPVKNKIFINISTFEDMENQIIEQMNRIFNGNKAMLAKELGISRTTLWKKLKKKQ
ncbi:sigma-54-dependent Fis family transcriptional regulator [Biomaibacter acetigenes]|uniref:Sigma-54-dependent Fis family transcriptional regulator n=1 Tax=Biomaibacter acetigenes TaxID=2316383 RepID=A0A3G2R5F8_9FIRM|nr:sigma-54-dependent Fis family transcriptional regulator [Biomaibacter acetigenes]AYO30575.1 sigma-54-dependent Fis family transcriptional regulator [Biomaibacter acetigenes]